MEKSGIFKLINSSSRNRIRLFIFPYAGGSASSFKDWEKYFSPEIEICSLQLPGREDRFYEKPYYHIEDVIREAGEGFAHLADLPFAIFGHSLGALLAYEFTRFLERNEKPLPQVVFLSGACPPGKLQINKRLHDLKDEELVNELIKFNGIPREILRNIDLFKMFLPGIRADLSIVESYQFKKDYEFSMPIIVFGGESDSVAPCSDLKAWNELAKAYCRFAFLPGDHFFIFSEKENLLAEINKELRYFLAVK